MLVTLRVIPLTWLNWYTYCRCLRKHLKCHFLQIELNNRLLYILHQSIIVSLITVSLEQLIHLFLTMYCLLPIPPRTLQRHPCPLTLWCDERLKGKTERSTRFEYTVLWGGTGKPKDRDEVNKREVGECDGWGCDVDTTGVPSIFDGKKTDYYESIKRELVNEDILFIMNR